MVWGFWAFRPKVWGLGGNLSTFEENRAVSCHCCPSRNEKAWSKGQEDYLESRVGFVSILLPILSHMTTPLIPVVHLLSPPDLPRNPSLFLGGLRGSVGV